MSKKDDASSEEDEEIKVILVGEMATGKTSLINTAVGLAFQEKINSTTTNAIMNKTLEIDGKPYAINLWDTIGQEKYRALTKIFIKDAKIIIFVYDITNMKSFKELKFWFQFTKEVINQDTVVAIVGNKSDLFLQEEVKEEEGIKLAKEYGYEFALTTALPRVEYVCAHFIMFSCSCKGRNVYIIQILRQLAPCAILFL